MGVAQREARGKAPIARVRPNRFDGRPAVGSGAALRVCENMQVEIWPTCIVSSHPCFGFGCACPVWSFAGCAPTLVLCVSVSVWCVSASVRALIPHHPCACPCPCYTHCCRTIFSPISGSDFVLLHPSSINERHLRDPALHLPHRPQH